MTAQPSADAELVELAVYDADPARLRQVYSSFPSGVAALITDDGTGPRGIVASAFTVGVSIDPPLVSCAIQRSSTTWPAMEDQERIGVSILGAGQESFARQIGGSDRARRFAGVPLRRTGSSARFIAGSPSWLECSVYDAHPAGDHTIVLLEVHGLGADLSVPPLVFHASAFHGLIGL